MIYPLSVCPASQLTVILVCGFSATNLFWSSLQYSNASCSVNLLATLQACIVLLGSEVEQMRKKSIAYKLGLCLWLVHCLISKKNILIFGIFCFPALFSSRGCRVRMVCACRVRAWLYWTAQAASKHTELQDNGRLTPSIPSPLMITDGQAQSCCRRHLLLHTDTNAKGIAAFFPRLLGCIYPCAFGFPSWWMWCLSTWHLHTPLTESAFRKCS